MRRNNRPIHARRTGSNVTVLCSGGIDSTTCLAYYLEERFHVEALFVEYGQLGATKETRAAESVCRHFRVPLSIIELTGVAPKGPGLITARNAFLLMTAALESRAKSGLIALGIHSGTRYPDCSSHFVRAMQRIFDAYTGGAVRIAAPFLSWKKSDIWAFAQTKNVPLSLTYSCERGLAQPCGTCDSCLDLEALRARSHHKN